MRYRLRQTGKPTEQAATLAEAKKAVSRAVSKWRGKAPRHTAVKRCDPDSPIGYRYALKYGGADVGFIAVEEP